MGLTAECSCVETPKLKPVMSDSICRCCRAADSDRHSLLRHEQTQETHEPEGYELLSLTTSGKRLAARLASLSFVVFRDDVF